MKTEQLVKRLKRGWLSSAQHFHEAGSLKLTTRVSELRHAYPVESRFVTKNGKRFCEYRLPRAA